MRAHEQAASTNEPGKKWYTKSLHCFTSKKNQKGKSKAGSDQAPCAARMILYQSYYYRGYIY